MCIPYVVVLFPYGSGRVIFGLYIFLAAYSIDEIDEKTKALREECASIEIPDDASVIDVRLIQNFVTQPCA